MTGHINYAAAQARHATSSKHVLETPIVVDRPERKSRGFRAFSLRRGRFARAYAA